MLQRFSGILFTDPEVGRLGDGDASLGFGEVGLGGPGTSGMVVAGGGGMPALVFKGAPVRPSYRKVSELGV